MTPFRLNASLYMYDYSSIHTFTTEVNTLGSTSTSVLAAGGAEVLGLEAELLWLASDNLTLGGNFSFTPSEYTESFLISDTSNANIPGSLYPEFETLTQDIKGNGLIQVPEKKFTGWASYNALSMVAILLNFSASTAGSMMSIIRRFEEQARWRRPTAALMLA